MPSGLDAPSTKDWGSYQRYAGHRSGPAAARENATLHTTDYVARRAHLNRVPGNPTDPTEVQAPPERAGQVIDRPGDSWVDQLSELKFNFRSVRELLDRHTKNWTTTLTDVIGTSAAKRCG